jgi:hypothetical protein
LGSLFEYLDPRPHLGPKALGFVSVKCQFREVGLFLLIDFTLAADQIDLLDGNEASAVVDLVSTVESGKGCLDG